MRACRICSDRDLLIPLSTFLYSRFDPASVMHASGNAREANRRCRPVACGYGFVIVEE